MAEIDENVDMIEASIQKTICQTVKFVGGVMITSMEGRITQAQLDYLVAMAKRPTTKEHD